MMEHPFHLLLLLLCLKYSTFAQTTSPAKGAVRCSDCHLNATCEENGDLHRCVCQDGFTGNGVNCSDLDECSRPGLNRCHSLATCINEPGTYSCSCPEGFNGDGYHCEGETFAEECMQSDGSLRCTDPCLNHTILEQTWRSTSYGSGPNCDSDKKGWYRFIGLGGVRMPEACVPVQRCNTAAPMWLNGFHPTTEAGIVTRTACAHWQSNCCYWSIPVQVKACLGGYYVYKFDGTPVCTLSYCTDPEYIENPCPKCEAEEECKLVNGKWGCYCSPALNISDISSLRPQLECGATEIKVSVEKCILKNKGFQNIIMSLRDHRCAGFEERGNWTMISVVTPTQAGQCGTQLVKNETHATYSNTLYLGDEAVIRENEIKINFHCSYPLDMEISLETAIQPIVSSINISVDGAGEFVLKMALYRDPNYTSPYEGKKAELSTRAWLYIGVMVTKGDTSQFVLRMDNCFATPTANDTDLQKYYIIQNSCPNPQDPTITVPENGVAPQGRFSLQVFKFVGKHDQVFLHCEIRLCDTSSESCKPHCPGVGNRLAADVGTGYVLHVGPIIRKGKFIYWPPPAAASHGLQGSWPAMLSLIAMGFSLHAVA